MPSDVDDLGIPRRGSALQIAYYVNCEPAALTSAVLGEDKTAIQWRSPLAAQRFIEFKDRPFLEAVDRAELAGELSDWWPESGPRWDALGVVPATGAVVLVEAKANLPEIAGGPACGAGSSGSEQGLANRQKIERALAATRAHYGIPEDVADAWLNTHCYQHANRLAHLCFFERHGVPVRLAHVYFTGDATHMSTSESEFDAQRQTDARAMGLDSVTIPSYAGVYLESQPDAYERLRAAVS